MVLGVGGLGSYAIQYLKLLTSASVIAIVRNDEKQNLAREMGADFVINSRTEDVNRRVRELTSNKGIDVSIDLVSSEETVQTAASSLAKGGAIVLVGLIGKSISFPVTETVLNEFSLMGSLWGNYTELKEVIELAKMKKIKSPVTYYKLEEANKVLEMLTKGRINGRAVLVP